MSRDEPDVLWLCATCYEPKPPSKFGTSRKRCLDCQVAITPMPVVKPAETAPAAEVDLEQSLRAQKIAKRCTKCGLLKSYSEFWKRSNVPDGYESWCKACKTEGHKPSMKSYYERNREVILARSLARKQRLRDEKRGI